MTLSNFDWTDKTSVKWFIMLPTGHEGPYSLEIILERCKTGLLSPEVQIWAEGLDQPVSIQFMTERCESKASSKPEPPFIPALPKFRPEEKVEAEEVETELPPLPIEESAIEEDLPPLPLMEEAPPLMRKKKGRRLALVSVAVLLLLSFALYKWTKLHEEFSIRRYSKMSLNLHERIQKEISFESWDKKIFFKEYVPVDLSHIWLITSGFQECNVEASFQSVENKLISLNDERIAFKTQGKLSDHVVEFSTFDFSSGNKIVPGMYELEVKATNCQWKNLVSSLANRFSPPDESYTAKTKVILFAKGASEYNNLLDKLVRKKQEIELKKQNLEEAFWQDLQQKFHTLLAISLQIEQHLLEFLAKDARQFDKNFKPAVDLYTSRFGHFLTKFVVSNEDYFQELRLRGESSHLSQKRDYELMVKQMALKIGFQSMKIIEEFQTFRRPKRIQLRPYESKIKKTFTLLKDEINQKIIQISDDRST
jgi:hypothetical protein